MNSHATNPSVPKRYLVILLLMLIVLPIQSAYASAPMRALLTEEELAWLDAHPVIRVVQDPVWPPVEYLDDKGQLAGMSNDYLMLIEEGLGISFERVTGLTWQQAYQLLRTWEIDMTTSVAETVERATFWAFTEPYMRIPLVIVCRNDVAYIGDMRELSGKRIAVVEHYAAYDWIPRDYPDIDMMAVATVEAGLKAVQRGEAFALIENMLVVGHYLTQMSLATTLKIAGETPYENAQSMAVRKDWPLLVSILDKALASIPTEQHTAIYRAWLPVRYEHHADTTRLIQAIVIAVVMMAGLGFWISLLKREIDKRKFAEQTAKLSEAHFRQLFETAPLPMGLTNKEGVLVEANNLWREVFGYSIEDIPTVEAWYELAYPDEAYRKSAIQQWQASLDTAKASEAKLIEPKDYHIRCKDGDIRSMQISGTIIGERILAVFFDITERRAVELEHRALLVQAEQTRKAILSALEDQKLAQESLKASNATLDAAIRSMTDAVFITDCGGRIILFNQAFVTYHRFESEQACMRSFEDYPAHFEVAFPDGKLAAPTQWAVPRALRGETVTNTEYVITCKDTGETWVGSYSFSPIYDNFKHLLGSVVVCRDITDSKQAADRLLYQRNHDYLTGLFNRGYLENELKHVADPSYLPVTIVMADTNGLKLVNDSFGHETGDEILKQTAQLLAASARPDDVVARYGGDEFVLLLPKTNSATAEHIVDSIETKVKRIEIDSFQLSLSFGYHTRTEATESFIETIKKAEDMMYRNKLYESASAKNKTIGLVINSLFAKSNRESQHSKRVSELCEAIAVRMGLSEREINRLRIAGLMHDIGKIGIPEEILNKPGRLTGEEWEAMQRHPETGYRILAASSDFSDISTAILEHHERWDGTGYPRGKLGADISMQARIIMIADSFDAMTSERSYKQSMSVTDALIEIDRCAGTQFDPVIASTFIETISGAHIQA
jgi:diguanylate cyclase (GGDEF)-like protein/PAS domain S-box-containing protein